MLRSRSTFLLIGLLILFISGCMINYRNKTRSYMSEEELQEIEDIYHPPVPEPEVVHEEFLAGFWGPALRVNGLTIDAREIEELYDYLLTYREESDEELMRMACLDWIATFAVISQWPDDMHLAVDRLVELKGRVDAGRDFGYLAVENSQEPGAAENAGDLGEIHRGEYAPLFEMHAFTDPIRMTSNPFPTIYGWHIMLVDSRNMDAPDGPEAHVSHIMIFHGLEPSNAELIRDNYERWTNLADIQVLAPSLGDILPEYPLVVEEENNGELQAE
jgi:hypothetical protein